MKLVQFRTNGRVRVGRIESDRIIPLEHEGDMVDMIHRFQSSGPDSIPGSPNERIALDDAVFMPVVSRPTKIMAVGLNYREHAAESKGEVPDSPLIFAKFPNALIGHGDEIRWDETVTRKVDFEAELAVVIGRKARNVSLGKALSHVFGYTCGNDVSARDLQFGDKQWVRGKSLDTFCPLGPWIVTSDEIPNPQDLRVRCYLNNKRMQNSHTGLMMFTVSDLISFLSRHFTLFPGDIIMSGTPSGVGVFRNPSVYMQDGDEVIVEIEGIGRLANTCRTYSD